MASSSVEGECIRVLVVDDHRSFSEALAMAIDFQQDLAAVGIATTVEDAIAMAREQPPDVVLTDIRLPDGDGIDATKRIKAVCPDAQVVALTAYTDLEVMARAAAAGMSGFISKERPISEIIQSIRTASDGSLSIDQSTLMAVLDRLAEAQAANERQEPLGRLTERELQVVALMGQGLDPRTIAKRLSISIHTARGYVKNILAKLNAHSQLEAVAIAARKGLLRRSDGAG